MTTKLEIFAWDTGEVVKTIDVSGQGERSIERVMRGLLCQVDRETYGVREVDAPRLESEPGPE